MAAAHPNRRPLLALVLLSPVIAEMLSGSSPPLEWLNPITPLLLIWLYGAGILVMRETAVRWRTGWPSILLLGAAYGIIEEGLAVKSFFDPGWMDLGTLAWYGRWFDVNWVWARLPSRRLPRSPHVYALAGFGFLMGSFLLYGGGPFFGIIPIITVLEGAAVLVGVMLLVRCTSDDPSRWARQRFAFVAGAMGFLIVLAAFLELAGWRGMGIVGAGFAYLMVRWDRRAPCVAAYEPRPAADPALDHETDSVSASGSAP